MASVVIQGDELYHYGILGMKWGVRRYQNYDGTLTPEGAARLEKHYYKSKKAIHNLKNKNEKLLRKTEKLENRNSKLIDKNTNNKYDKKISSNKEKIDELKAKALKYEIKAKNFIAAREELYSNINYDSIPKEDIEKGKAYAIYINALQSKDVTNENFERINSLVNQYKKELGDAENPSLLYAIFGNPEEDAKQARLKLKSISAEKDSQEMLKEFNRKVLEEY